MTVVTPKETCIMTHKCNEDSKHLSIYLGGSVDYDWQSEVIAKIANSSIDYGRHTVVYNPRKMHGTGCHELLQYESWKDKCLKRSDVILVNFVPGCEDGLGLLSDSDLRDRMIVFCPHDHKHFSTVRYVCREHGMCLVTGSTIDENDILESLYEFINK